MDFCSLKLSCVLHVLIHVVQHFISEDILDDECDDSEVVPSQISLKTMQIAEKLVQYFSEQREIFLSVSVAFS